MSVDWIALAQAEGVDPALVVSHGDGVACTVSPRQGARLEIWWTATTPSWGWSVGCSGYITEESPDVAFREGVAALRMRADARIADLQRERARLGGAT